MKTIGFLLVFFIATSNLFSATSASELKARLGLLGAGPDVFAYEISVLKLALENCGEAVDLTINNLQMPQERALIELETGRADFNIFFTGFSANRENRFYQVDVPLTRGLLGHRILMTTERFLDDLASIRSLESLRQFAVIGSGTGWPDTEILSSNGFHTVASDYESLWRMLAAERINTFNRGIHEAYVEHRQQSSIFPTLVVDPALMIRYRFDYMFYVRKQDEQLGKLIERGLRRAYETGAFMRHFENHPMIRKVLREAQVEERLVFDIDNPLMTDRQRQIPDSYWHHF